MTTWRALSFWRPWPALIVYAGKRIENRSWYTAYRGPFAIHAGKHWDDTAFDFADNVRWIGTVEDLCLSGWSADHPTGVVAFADLIDVCGRTVGDTAGPCDCGPWAVPGQYHWRLDSVSALVDPIPMRGWQGWFQVNVPEELIAA